MKKKTVLLFVVLTIVLGLFSCRKKPTTFTVTFYSDTEKDSRIHQSFKKVAKGATIEMPLDPKKEKHRFLGWYLEDGTPFDVKQAITANLAVYPKYKSYLEFYMEYIKTSDAFTRNVDAIKGEYYTYEKTIDDDSFSFVIYQDGKILLAGERMLEGKKLAIDIEINYNQSNKFKLSAAYDSLTHVDDSVKYQTTSGTIDLKYEENFDLDFLEIIRSFGEAIMGHYKSLYLGLDSDLPLY